jgi:hypothetical protein
MPNEWFLVYLTIATLYGYVMYKMGQTNGYFALVTVLIDAKIIKSHDAMQEQIQKYWDSKQEDEEG